MTATVVRYAVLDMQVCVPEDWTDAEVVAFADKGTPCGTDGGWHIRRAGNAALCGDPERAPCESRHRHVHITLDA